MGGRSSSRAALAACGGAATAADPRVCAPAAAAALGHPPTHPPTPHKHTPRAVPNMTAKVKGEKQVLVGEEVLGCRDVSALVPRRPVDRGYVVAWDLQKEIWTR